MKHETTIGQKLLMAFHGKEGPTPQVLEALRRYRPAGISLFRGPNIENPGQLREHTARYQHAASELGLPPLLFAVDQEGGQLTAIGAGTTRLPGNLALGATGSSELAFAAGEVLGRELSAMGIQINYAPVLDVNSNPQNPSIGTRSFGEDPERVALLGAAMLQGMQSSGVAATAKHFPGHGDASGDSHFTVPSVAHSLERLHQVELPPFAAAVRAGVKMVMTAHLALPAVDPYPDRPATLSPQVLRGLLRAELGFEGVIITDALDMRAIQQGSGLGLDAVCAVAAGADLMLVMFDEQDQETIFQSLVQAAQRGLLAQDDLESSGRRIQALRDWLAAAPKQPDLEVVNSRQHQQVAQEIAQRSITLVRDRANLLPLQLGANEQIVVISHQPADITPADTSSYEKADLAEALRGLGLRAEAIWLPDAPQEADLAALRSQLAGYDPAHTRLVVCTLNAGARPGQAESVRLALASGIPTVAAALRMPYDLAAYPEAPTYLCSYSILGPSLQALAQVLVGHQSPQGKLPVSIPGFYRSGHGVEFGETPVGGSK